MPLDLAQFRAATLIACASCEALQVLVDGTVRYADAARTIPPSAGLGVGNADERAISFLNALAGLLVNDKTLTVAIGMRLHEAKANSYVCFYIASNNNRNKEALCTAAEKMLRDLREIKTKKDALDAVCEIAICASPEILGGAGVHNSSGEHIRDLDYAFKRAMLDFRFRAYLYLQSKSLHRIRKAGRLIFAKRIFAALRKDGANKTLVDGLENLYDATTKYLKAKEKDQKDCMTGYMEAVGDMHVLLRKLDDGSFLGICDSKALAHSNLRPDAISYFWRKVSTVEREVLAMLQVPVSGQFRSILARDVAITFIPQRETSLHYDFYDNRIMGLASECGLESSNYSELWEGAKNKKAASQTRPVKLREDTGTAHAHCELSLISFFLNSEERFYPYIGISKLSCASCWMFVRAIANHYGEQFYLKGCHGKMYSGWVFPDLNDTNKAILIENGMKETVVQHLSHSYNVAAANTMEFALPDDGSDASDRSVLFGSNVSRLAKAGKIRL